MPDQLRCGGLVRSCMDTALPLAARGELQRDIQAARWTSGNPLCKSLAQAGLLSWEEVRKLYKK